jgi:hypothetical protein
MEFEREFNLPYAKVPKAQKLMPCADEISNFSCRIE